MTCRDLLYLKSLSQVELLAGEGGLDNIISWPYMILVQPISPWVNGGELIIYFGAGMSNTEDSLYELMTEIRDNSLAGILFLIGETYITHIPDRVIEAGNRWNIPVFATSTAAYVGKITHDIADLIYKQNIITERGAAFWHSLFTDEYVNDPNKVLSQAMYYSIDYNGTYCVYIIRFMNLVEYAQNPNKPEGFRHLDAFLDNFHRRAGYFISTRHALFWELSQQESITVVFPVEKLAEIERMNQTAQELCRHLQEQFPGAIVRASKGTPYNGLPGARRSFIEAKQALYLPTPYCDPDSKKQNPDCSDASGAAAEPLLIDYSDLGLFRIFYEVYSREHLQKYIDDYLMPLIHYDEKNDAKLIHTLEVYYQHRGNVSETARAMFLHRNTLIARIAKIEQLLNISLDHPLSFYNLYLAIQARYFIENVP